MGATFLPCFRQRTWGFLWTFDTLTPFKKNQCGLTNIHEVVDVFLLLVKTFNPFVTNKTPDNVPNINFAALWEANVYCSNLNWKGKFGGVLAASLWINCKYLMRNFLILFLNQRSLQHVGLKWRFSGAPISGRKWMAYPTLYWVQQIIIYGNICYSFAFLDLLYCMTNYTYIMCLYKWIHVCSVGQYTLW